MSNSKTAEQTIAQNIEEYGCHIALFEADSYLPPFAYTIGLYKNFNCAEVICFGLPVDVMGSLLNTVRDMAEDNEPIVVGKKYSNFLDEHDVEFIEVNQAYYNDYLGYAGWFYKNFDFPVLQLVWPDKAHKFPWDKDFNKEWTFLQPLLDRNTDFKFYEERNLGVYTTKDVLNGAAILYVYHNDDGNWQFHSSANPNTDEAQMVALEDITKLDPTVNDVYFLQYGTKAWRKDAKSPWETEILGGGCGCSK